MTNREHVLPGAESALDRFKFEVARELGLDDKIRDVGWENMTTHEVGKIGGNMVRRMVGHAEKDLAAQEAEDSGTTRRGGADGSGQHR